MPALKQLAGLSQAREAHPGHRKQIRRKADKKIINLSKRKSKFFFHTDLDSNALPIWRGKFLLYARKFFPSPVCWKPIQRGSDNRKYSFSRRQPEKDLPRRP